MERAMSGRTSPYRTRRASMAGNGGNGTKAKVATTKASSTSKPAPLTKWGVLFFYPNIIGYVRVLATLYSLYLGVQRRESWEPMVLLYFFGFALDAVDGYVARLVGQESQFGAVLDMVTDRTATAGLCMVNMALETCELRKFGWVALVMLDIGSHWAHCMSVKGHHKSDSANKNKNIILRAYYAVKPLFLACCLGQEVFYLAHFVLAKAPKTGLFYNVPDWVPAPLADALEPHFPFHALKALWKVSLALCAVKQVVNVAQLCSAAMALAEGDAKKKAK